MGRLLHLVIILLLFSSIHLHRASAQCSVDYSTTNYFCDLDSLYLHANPTSGTGPFTFLWETGETTQTILIPLALGDYMVTMTDATGCVAIINCHIKPFPPVLFYPYNQNACEGDTVILFLEWFRDSIPGATYLWSTGETTPTITLTDDLVWSVTVTDPNTGCEFVIPEGLFDFHPTPYPEIVGEDILCNGQTVTLSVIGGPFGTIVWYPEFLYQETLDVTQPGEYIVWTSSPEAGYCWHQDTIVISEGEIDDPLVEGPPELCAEQEETITLTNSSLFESYIWNTGATTESITASDPGTYTVTVTNDIGCTASASISVAFDEGPQGSAVPTAATCGRPNGSIDLSVTPPDAYEYVWSNGMTSQDISNVMPGTYSVTVTNPEGCFTIVEADIPDQPITITVSEVISPNTNCGQFNGAINLTPSPANEDFIFAWSNGANSEDLIDILPGIYTVSITIGSNCNFTDSYTVADNSNAPDVETMVTPATCGLSNGAVNLALTGGTSPFTYLWSNGSSSESIEALVPGNYAVTITGSDGCSAFAAAFVPDEIMPITIMGNVSSNTSCSGGNGAIDITVSPNEIYNFMWSNGGVEEDLFNLGAGSYSVTATLGNSCIQTATFEVINENIPFTISGSTTPNTSCQTPNGSIDLNISPAGSYTFNWSNGASAEDLQNLDQGNYTVTVTNTTGCEITSLFNIISVTPVVSLTATTNPDTSCTTPTGSIDITISPIGTYTYTWSNGSITEDISGLAANTYSVTVEDANQCKTIDTFTIASSVTPIQWTSAITDEMCLSSNGAIDLQPTPSNNTYSWSNGSTSEDLQNVTSGPYSVIITSANGCTYHDTFTVNNVNSNFSITGLTTDNPSCVTPGGSIDISVNPTGSYTFQWSTGTANEDITLLTEGTYVVTVTDAANCASTASFIIANTAQDPVIAETITPASCGNDNGGITISVTPPGNNLVAWSNGNTTSNLIDLSPGTYAVTVTAENGCTAAAGYVVPEVGSNLKLNSTIGDVTSCTETNGFIDIQVEPAGTYTFTWSNGMTTEDIQNVPAGLYSVSVKDSLGCELVSSFTIEENLVIPSITGNANPATCGQPSGSIDISVTPLGVYQFSWSNGAGVEDPANLIEGFYEVTVTSESGCSVSAGFTVGNVNSNFTIEASQVDDYSCTLDEGEIDLTISPVGVYVFQWSNGSITEDLTSIAPGTYIVTVTDANQCASTATLTIEDLTSQPVLESSMLPTTCGESNGEIQLTVTPGNNIQYEWSSGHQGGNVNNLAPGAYSVTVTDEFGCTASGDFTIPSSSPVQVTIEADLSAQENGIVTCSLSLNQPMGSIERIEWSPVELLSCTGTMCTEQAFNLTERTEVGVMVVDTNGCMGVANLILEVEVDYKVYIPNVFTPNGNGQNDEFTVYTNEEVEEVVLLEIFDRWGNKVFVNEHFPPNDEQYGWDGVYKNQLMNPAVFAYQVVVRFSNDEIRDYKGDVTLVR